MPTDLVDLSGLVPARMFDVVLGRAAGRPVRPGNGPRAALARAGPSRRVGPVPRLRDSAAMRLGDFSAAAISERWAP
jgi:hypothetical protein